MISTPFDYTRAQTLDDAIAQLKASNGSAKLIAGGHSLVPLMKLRLSEPEALIDIAKIPGLSGIRDVGGKIEIGAGTPHHDVATSPLLRDVCPMLAETAASIGDPQVRNRGTLGGSLAHADPAADYPAAVLALDAGIQIKGSKGSRLAKATSFFRGLFSVDLAADEIITGIEFAPAKTAAYAKLHQRASHFAIVGVAAVLDVSNGAIRSARIGLTGAGPSATRLKAVEARLAGAPATAVGIEAAVSLAADGVEDLNADIHASEEYRRAMIPVFTRRAILAALARVR